MLLTSKLSSIRLPFDTFLLPVSKVSRLCHFYNHFHFMRSFRRKGETSCVHIVDTMDFQVLVLKRFKYSLSLLAFRGEESCIYFMLADANIYLNGRWNDITQMAGKSSVPSMSSCISSSLIMASSSDIASGIQSALNLSRLSQRVSGSSTGCSPNRKSTDAMQVRALS